MASAIDSKPYHSSSGLVDPYTLAGTDEAIPQGKPPAGNITRSPSVARKVRPQHGLSGEQTEGEDSERIFVQIETMPDSEAARRSRHRARCRCKDSTESPERVVRHDAFITPQPRILTQRASSANRLHGPSPHMSKCEAVQIVDLQVAAIGDDAAAAAAKESKESLVPIARPGSAQPSVRRKKHHVVVISRDGRERSASGQRNKSVLASQSLTDLVNRYPDPRRPHRSSSGEREPRESKDEKALSTIHSVQGDDAHADTHTKAKATKQVRINSAVQIYDDLDIEENHRHRLSHAAGPFPHSGDRSRSQVMNITKLRGDYSYRGKTMVADRSRLNIPDNIPQGSVVRIQHTSKGKIKVITGSEGQFTTTILEGNRKPPGGPRPPTRLDLMDDVLVITRKTSTSKDAYVTSRPSSGNKAIQASSEQQKSAETKPKDGSPTRKPEKNTFAFRDRVSKTPAVSETKAKTIELNNPYVQVADGKGEAMQRSETSLLYQHSQPTLSARQQQRWKPNDSVPEPKPETSNPAPTKVEHKIGKHRQYAQSRYRLQTDSLTNKLSRQITFQYDSHKPPPVDDTPTVEEDYNSPARHKWELEYEDYVPPNQEQLQAEEAPPLAKESPKAEADTEITDAQTLAEKQYYSARHQYVKQWREQHSHPQFTQLQYSQLQQSQQPDPSRQPDPQPPPRKVPEKEATPKVTHTVVMQAKAAENPLPPKQQLWSKDSFLQSQNHHKGKPHGSPYAIPAPPRSPSRSRSRRRSASRTRRPTTPNTNLVADQLQDERAVASRRARLQATSTELFEDSMYENYAHSKFKSKSRPSSSSRTRPQVVDRETMVKLLHMTMPRKQPETEQF
jgi:hypothetical protein